MEQCVRGLYTKDQRRKKGSFSLRVGRAYYVAFGLVLANRLEPSHAGASSSKLFGAVNQERHGAVVDERDVHVRLKASGLDLDALPSNLGHETAI